MKTFISLLIFMAMIALFLIGLNKCGNNLSTAIEKRQEKIGEKIVLKKDTLMIIDYSILNDNYTLEDGRKVNVKLIDNLKQINQ